MSKSKNKGSSKPEPQTLSKVKGAAVTKPSQTPKSKSKELAKKVAAKEEIPKKKSKKVKEPSPEPSESEGDESDESESASGEDSEKEDKASESESDSDSESEAEAKGGAPLSKVQPKTNTAAKLATQDDSDSESSESSDDEEAKPVIKNGINGAAKKEVVDKDSEDSEEDSDESDDSEEEKPKTKAPVQAAAPKAPIAAKTDKKAPVKKAESDDESDDSESDSASEEDSDDSDEEESDEEPALKKRKAEESVAAPVKKTKTEVSDNPDASNNLFVGSISWNVDEERLASEFQGFGELTRVAIMTDKQTGRSKGFGYVEFTNTADAVKAHKAMQGFYLDGRALNVDFSRPRPEQGDRQDRFKSRAQSFGDQTSPESSTLFIGNVSWGATQDLIEEMFSPYGSINAIRLPTDMETGQLKGFGYVEFSSVDEAREAMGTLNGADLDNRAIRLDFSTPRQNNDSPRGDRRGGGGGFRGGRGGGFGDRGSRGGRGGFGDRGGRGGGRGRGGFGDRGGRGRGGSTNRGGMGDYQGKKMTF